MSRYKDKCRFCLAKGRNFKNIHDEAPSSLEFIYSVFQSKIELDAGKPTESKICDACHQTLTAFYEYYKSVLRNQAFFANKGKLVYEVFISTDSHADGQIPMKIEVELTEPITNDIETTECSTEELLLDEGKEDNSQEEVNPPRPTEKHVYKIPTESSSLYSIDEQLPAHLQSRSRKAESDAKIREFVKLKCDLCADRPESFRTFKELQTHFVEAHQTRGYIICCDKKIFRKDRILNHITNHVNPDAFKCPICGQISKSKILLRIHIKQHLPNEERKFQCDKCSQKFVLKSQLTNHEASHLADTEKQFICDECGKAFALKFVMAKHKLTHAKTKDFVCDVCAKPFATSASLQIHRTHHSSEPKPRVQCKQCKQWYKNAETLRSHQRRHRDIRKHICMVCGKECSTQSSLTAHTRYVHLKVCEHKCNICQKQFRRKLELTEHMARHTGQVLYRCSNCPKTFSSSSNYFAHRKNRHPDEAKVMGTHKSG